MHLQLDAALAAGRRTGASAGLLVLDLDRFKELNDTLGHHAGDVLLAQLGPRLRDALTDGEVAGRLGGDEFAVVVGADATAARLADTAARLHRALRSPSSWTGISLHARASIGVALWPEHWKTPPRCCARRRRHVPGQAGRHAATSPTGRARRPHATGWGCSRRCAPVGAASWSLHYQPKSRGRTGVVGVEALIRWQHAERGLLRPAAFLGPAEEAGRSRDITRAVLEQALGPARLEREGIELSVAVNLRRPTCSTPAPRRRGARSGVAALPPTGSRSRSPRTS